MGYAFTHGDALEGDARKNLRWFTDQWLEQTGVPDYRLTWKQDGKTLRGTVSQPAPYFQAALEIEVQGSRRSFDRVIEIAGDHVSFDWNLPFRVNSVTLDPHYRVLRWTPEFRAHFLRKQKP